MVFPWAGVAAPAQRFACGQRAADSSGLSRLQSCWSRMFGRFPCASRARVHVFHLASSGTAVPPLHHLMAKVTRWAEAAARETSMARAMAAGPERPAAGAGWGRPRSRVRGGDGPAVWCGVGTAPRFGGARPGRPRALGARPGWLALWVRGQDGLRWAQGTWARDKLSATPGRRPTPLSGGSH